MAKVLGLSEKDAGRLQRMLTWFERFGNTVGSSLDIAPDPPFRMQAAIAEEHNDIDDEEEKAVRLCDADGEKITDDDLGKIKARPWLGSVSEDDPVFAFRKFGKWWLINNASRFLLCKADASVNKGSSGTFSIFSGDPGSESDTGENIQARCPFYKAAAGKWCLAAKTNDGWYIIETEPTALAVVTGVTTGTIVTGVTPHTGTVVTDVSWDEDTCEMTKSTGTAVTSVDVTTGTGVLSATTGTAYHYPPS